MISSDVSAATNGNDVIVETVRVLLAAGSDITTTTYKDNGSSLLDCLLDLVFMDFKQRFNLPYLHMYTHRLELVTDLMKLLIRNGATLKSHAYYWQASILLQTATLVHYLPAPLLPISTRKNTSDFIDPDKVIIDIWCDMSVIFLRTHYCRERFGERKVVGGHSVGRHHH